MGVDGLRSEPPLTSELAFERRWSVRLRVGARANVVVGIVALVVAVAAAVILVISFATAGGPTHTTIGSARLGLLLALALGAVGVAATWRIWRVTRDGRWVPTSPILPALVEDGGRVVIEKYSGACPECGGRLRFYNRPVRWHYEPDEAGRRTVVDERSPSAECRRDTRHWWTIDR
ncbi:hypothetical protein G3T36_01675 [Diaminobutyricibacter tongyongensis]|uniref:Uncharacterized protein n=1 Tax=Leifsonia tongyongensis TaxID=1268043 RepID=A0A6L9XT45_9MICO|nr:hypothetical protein [Diaminobutyricibacter tongyongensis]NEN04572.1 hypothetical protein [Diaminobutyricibacter tongyongensis]